MQWVASTLCTISEHGVSNITTADIHTSAASIRLNWRPHRFKWTRPFRRKTKSGFCACAITFQLASGVPSHFNWPPVCRHISTGFYYTMHALSPAHSTQSSQKTRRPQPSVMLPVTSFETRCHSTLSTVKPSSVVSWLTVNDNLPLQTQSYGWSL